MLHRMRSKEAIATPQPTYMSNKQMGTYLDDLRTNRVARPSGARPAPAPSIRRRRDPEVDAITPSEPVKAARNNGSAHSHNRSSSVLSQTMRSMTRASSGAIIADALRTEALMASVDRAKEKQEAHEVRVAMDSLDLKDDKQVYSEAQAEATDLITKHQNPNAPYRSANKISPRTSLGATHGMRQLSADLPPKFTEQTLAHDDTGIRVAKRGTARNQTAGDKVDQQEQERRTSLKLSGHFSITSLAKGRRSSGARSFSGRTRSGQFPNAREKIYEDPSEEAESVSPITPPIILPPPDSVSVEEPRPITQTRPNPFQRVQSMRHSLPSSTHRSSYSPSPSFQGPHRVEIHRNPPSQSRNPNYVSNSVSEPEKPRTPTRNKAEPTKEHRNSLDIRSEEIRAATSMKMKDRSESLPSPAFVSDTPGRPIVSFQPDWTPREADAAPKPLFFDQASDTSSSRFPAAPRPHAAQLAHTLTSVTSTGMEMPLVIVNDYEAPPRPSRSPYEDSMPQVSKLSMNEGPSFAIPSIDIPLITIDETPRPIRQKHVTMSEPPMITINETPTSLITEPPKISISDTPTIMINEPPNISTTTPPSITISGPSKRPQHRSVRQNVRSFSQTKPPGGANHASTTPHQSPSARRTTALCAQCALPIAGRIVSAAGTRFHPECFTCFHCDTGLECVAFYPEPDERRMSRVERIRARMEGEGVDDDEYEEGGANGEEEDGDESMRFYCHLDYHELFSPRCKSCKTPIEGEVILACGAEWHVGHFFCAQCGDPFDPTTPFVEKDGYAWCVGCHTTRFSAKCKRCRKPVTDMVVNALGAEWHEECFSCTECHGAFSDGRYFLRGGSQDPVCFACEEMRLKF